MKKQCEAAPQSNQRGIETGLMGGTHLGRDPVPQSNQRGIETSFPQLEAIFRIASIRPQSNQRGIETRVALSRASQPPAGLNRTSVGLKPQRAAVGRTARIRPQSNQRGIETQSFQCHPVLAFPASIEPAWD